MWRGFGLNWVRLASVVHGRLFAGDVADFVAGDVADFVAGDIAGMIADFLPEFLAEDLPEIRPESLPAMWVARGEDGVGTGRGAQRAMGRDGWEGWWLCGVGVGSM